MSAAFLNLNDLVHHFGSCSNTYLIDDMKIFRIHSVFWISLLLLSYHKNKVDARFSFKSMMQKVGSFAKAAAATGLALAASKLPIPLSIIPGVSQLQSKLGPGLNVAGVDLAQAAADPKAAAKQLAMKQVQKTTGVDVQGLSQMAQGGQLRRLATMGAGMQPRGA